MTSRMDRRHAIAALGAAGLGGLLAAGCSDDDDSSGSTTTTSDEATDTTGATTTTTGAGTGDTSDLVGRFEDATTCSLTPEETEGPYYLDVDLVRSDIREDRQGTALRLGVRVLDADCQPLPNAVVDVWHCDGEGLYSGYEEASQGGPGGGSATDDGTYLRGTQVTDANGIVQFTTTYPGWYQGRTVHIHAKAHLSNQEVLTTQFYFDEAVTATVYQQPPYASDTGRDTTNETDGLFLADTVLTLSQEGDGYLGLLNMSVEADDGA
jgi:protocatechuate 3,4-dioxygenase beta subunit